MPGPLIHPHQTLTTRDGEQVEIDTEMAPVIRELWRLGYTTLACCQDVGEATSGVREQADRPLGYGVGGFIEYHRGWAPPIVPIGGHPSRRTDGAGPLQPRPAVTTRRQRPPVRLAAR